MEAVNRVLEQSVPHSTVEGVEVLTPEVLEEKTKDAEFEEALVFESSGTSSGQPKRIPYGYEELQDQREHEALAFEIGGLRPEHTVMTLGAPLPSISGWASRSGSRELGADVLNRSFNDYEKVIEWKENEDVNSTFATPLVIQQIGDDIEEEYGLKPKEIFPNIETGFMFGDLLPDNLRDQIKSQWGFEELRSLYGTVEADVVAIGEEKSDKLVPMLNKHVLEIRPYEDGEYKDELIDIRELEEETVGSLVISDVDRNKIELDRYEIGDAVRIHPELPRMDVLGRIDETINLGGAPLHENTIHKALLDTYGEDLEEWKVHASRPGREAGGSDSYNPALDIYVAGDVEERPDEFLDNLFERSNPIKEAYQDVEIIEYIDIHQVESKVKLETRGSNELERDQKSNRIIFHPSY